MRSSAVAATFALTVGLMAGCGHEFEPPDRSGRVREAAAAFQPTMFDSVTWASQEARLNDGNLVYVEECRRCHGQLGQGETNYASERGLDVPSLVDPDWRLAQLDSIRRSVFVGHDVAMPLFGDSDLTLRQIDAVGAYILLVLRPDVLGGG